MNEFVTEEQCDGHTVTEISLDLENLFSAVSNSGVSVGAFHNVLTLWLESGGSRLAS
jgi:hypothetical protein